MIGYHVCFDSSWNHTVVRLFWCLILHIYFPVKSQKINNPSHEVQVISIKTNRVTDKFSHTTINQIYSLLFVVLSYQSKVYTKVMNEHYIMNENNIAAVQCEFSFKNRQKMLPNSKNSNRTLIFKFKIIFYWPCFLFFLPSMNHN